MSENGTVETLLSTRTYESWNEIFVISKYLHIFLVPTALCIRETPVAPMLPTNGYKWTNEMRIELFLRRSCGGWIYLAFWLCGSLCHLLDIHRWTGHDWARCCLFFLRLLSRVCVCVLVSTQPSANRKYFPHASQEYRWSPVWQKQRIIGSLVGCPVILQTQGGNRNCKKSLNCLFTLIIKHHSGSHVAFLNISWNAFYYNDHLIQSSCIKDTVSVRQFDRL